MAWIDGWLHRVKTLLRSDEYERELQEEMRLHLELDALQHGDTDRARRRFGNRTYYQEETRRMTWHVWLDSIRQDVVYAARSLRRSPGLTAGVVLTLALGLGVNMAMFSFLDVVFLRKPAGVDRPDDVRRAWKEVWFMSGPQFWSGHSYPQYAALTTALGDGVATTIYSPPRNHRFGPTDSDAQVRVSYTTASYFDLLGVRAAAGRLYGVDEDRMGAGAMVAVASHAFWRRQLGGDAAAIGRDIFLGGRRFTLIGVAAETFSGVELDATDLWVPVASYPASAGWWNADRVNGFQLLLRPRAGAATSDGALVERLARGYNAPEARRLPGDTTHVVQLGSIVRAQGPGSKEHEITVATRLFGVTVVVLLIACANVINLLLARAVKRRREIAVRLAMGVSRIRLARLLVSESVLLALLAAGAALLAAYWGGAILRGLMLPNVHWAEGASPLHWRVVALALATGLGAGILAGVLPALQSLKTDLTNALKDGAAGGHAHRSFARDALVVAQTALSVVLLVGAGLFVSSLLNVRALRTGFDARQVVFGSVQHDMRDSLRDAMMPQRFREIAERLRGLQSVEGVALARMAPTRGFSAMTFHPDVDTLRYRKPFAIFNLVSPEFFETVGLRMLRGENFPRVSQGAMPQVVVVNDAFARSQWRGMDPIGRCLRFEDQPDCYRVIGVVETSMFNALIEKPQAQYYLSTDNPPRDAGAWFSTLVVRTQPHSRDAVSAQMRNVIREAYPAGRPTFNTLEEYLDPQYRPWRLGATLFTAFGALALIVAAIGMYSTVSYVVAQRTHEFGVRSALGAQARDIVSNVLRGNLRVVGIGIGVGLTLAVLAGRFVAALLYGIDPGDPGIMMGVVGVLLVTAALAALGPAWRAARVSPVIALRVE